MSQTLGRLARYCLLVISVLLVLWAFARVGIREASRFTTTGSDTELVVMHWSGDGGPAEDAIVERALERFEEANPGIRVTRLNPGDAGSFYTKLQTMMAAGTPPDVFYVGAERLASYAEAGLLLSLDEWIEVDGTSDDFELDAFYPATVDAFRFEDGKVGQGRLWGIPKDFTTVGFYYNRNLLEQAGVSEPSSDWTWDAFIESARAVGQLPGCTGAEFVTWPSMIRAVLWTEEVDLLDDENAIRFDDQKVIEVLERIRSWRHDETNTLTSGRSETANPASRFLGGKLGFAGPFGRWVVPTYRTITDFEWDYAPLPRGETSANMIATVAWGISGDTRHPKESWKLVSWLTGADTQSEQARLGLAIPTNRHVAQSDAFMDSQTPPSRDIDFLTPVATSRVVPWPPNPALEGTVAKRLDQAIRTGDLQVPEALRQMHGWWEAERSSPLARTDHPSMPWAWIVSVFLIGIVLAIGMGVWLLRRMKPDSTIATEERTGWLLISPWVIGFLLFMAVPILLSLCLSLTRWSGITTLGEADFVGVANYSKLLGEDDVFWQSLKVTAIYALLAVPIGQALALLGAVLMNIKIRGVSFFRAAWYLPSILAGVGMAVLFRWVFNAENGLLNVMLEPVLSPLGLDPPDWFVKDAEIFGAPAFAIMSLWLVGGSMMIYLAGLQNVPRSLYEAAEIDRAGPVRRFVSVTIPMISPVILFNVIMSLIGSFQVFTQAFVMTGGGPGDHTRFYVLYLYNQAFDYYEMGYASAMAWLLLLIILALTILTMRGSSRMVHYEGLR